MENGVSWQVVALLCSVIVALLGTVTALIVSRFTAQSKKTADLTKLVHDVNGAHRERMSRIEARIETVREVLETGARETRDRVDRNVPELHEKWERHCLDHKKGTVT